VQLRETAGCN